ncbi:MAG: M16 family metallopeptidase [Bdellovibrionales bacterium]
MLRFAPSLLSMIFVLLFSLSATAQDKVFNASEIFLDNGMQVVVIPNNRAPVVTHMVWYKVGAADEVQGHSGAAHFLEHLLFKGSDVIGGDPLAPGEFSKIVRRMGGNDNAFTGQDFTAYFQSVPADALEQVMRMEAGRMRGAKPPLEDVDSERLVILEERRQRTDNDPRGRFGEQMAAAAYVNHPYGTPVIGWYHEMETLDWDSLKVFYDTWYGPNNAILIVAGDVTPDDVFTLARDIYGQIPSHDNIPKRERTQSPIMNSKTVVTLTHPVIRESVFQTLYRVASYRQNKEHALALQVLQEIMGGGATSRLYKSLVVDQKIASSAGLSYRPNSFDDSSLWVYANPLPGVDVDTIETALQEELITVIKDGVNAQELVDAKTRMQDAAIYARDSVSGPAMVIGFGLSTGSTLNDIETWPSQINNVTADQIQEVAALYLNPESPPDIPPVSGILLPLKKADKQDNAAKEVAE